MKTSMMMGLAAAAAFTTVVLLSGPQLVSNAQAASIVGGNCTTTFNDSKCLAAGTCADINGHIFDNDCSSQGGFCTRCTDESHTIYGCAGGHQGNSCGYKEDPVDCGVAWTGICSGGTCKFGTPDPNDPCDNGLDCCTH